MTRPEIVNMRFVFTITVRAVDQCFVSYVLVLAAAFTLVEFSRHHQGVVMLLGWLAHRGPQSRHRCFFGFVAQAKLAQFVSAGASALHTPSLLVLI